MVNEVESILNEIRERVRTDQEHDSAGKDSLAQPHAKSAREYAARHARSLEFPEESEPGNGESLNRLSAHLTTTGRAWDRLPPMYSNRRGGTARIEVWIKARLKSMSRWFTWEQVNFNSAVHHALSETLHTLSVYQQELAGLRSELTKEAESWREKFERSDRELRALRAGIEALTAELRKNLTALAGELRQSDEQLREEQRVCFKQLSLETSEAAVTEDRGRRTIESRLDKLEKAVLNGEE